MMCRILKEVWKWLQSASTEDEIFHQICWQLLTDMQVRRCALWMC